MSDSDTSPRLTPEDLVARDKANLDITWLKDDSLDDVDNLPAPDVIARQIIDDLRTALAEFEAVAHAGVARAVLVRGRRGRGGGGPHREHGRLRPVRQPARRPRPHSTGVATREDPGRTANAESRTQRARSVLAIALPCGLIRL